MGPRTTKLVNLLESAASLLRSHNELHWSAWLEQDVARLKSSDFGGIEHFLQAFGGMGSINDLMLHPLNGHTLAESEVESVNERLGTLLSEAIELARQVRNDAVFSSGSVGRYHCAG